MTEQDALRARVFTVWYESWEKGTPISLRELSARSPEIFGERISWDTLKLWSSQEDWRHRLYVSLDRNPKLRRIKEQFDLWHRKWDEADSHKARAIAARTFRTVVQRMPLAFRPAVEAQIIEVRDSIAEYIRDHADDCPDSQLSTMTNALMQLEGSIHVFVEVDHDGVNLDAVVLEDRV